MPNGVEWEVQKNEIADDSMDPLLRCHDGYSERLRTDKCAGDDRSGNAEIDPASGGSGGFEGAFYRQQP